MQPPLFITTATDINKHVLLPISQCLLPWRFIWSPSPTAEFVRQKCVYNHNGVEVKRKVNRNANFNTIHPDRITPDWNEQTPEQKKREQMAQLNPEIVLRMIS